MMEITGSEHLRFGPYEVDLHTHELWKHGTKLKLVGQPFDILAVLVKRPGQLVTREELRSQLWPGDTFVDFNHGLNAAVNKLRDALCDSAEDPKYIETLPRRGYRFIAQVQPAVGQPEHLQQANRAGDTPAAAGNGRQDMPAQSAVTLPMTVALAGAEAEVDAVADTTILPQPCLPQTGWAARSLRWLRYVVPIVVLALGLWRLSGLLHSWERGLEEKEAKYSEENKATNTFTPLTGLSDRTEQPAFSPDGNRVAFRRQSFVPGSSGIWVKQVGGEEITQLTNSPEDSSPVWSPDGRFVAFTRRADSRRSIYTVPAGGGELRPIGDVSADQYQGELDWSPDGKGIAFVGRGRNGASSIFLVLLDDNHARQITTPPKERIDWGPAFSPDGTRLAFVRSGHLMTMAIEGAEVRQLTDSPSDASIQVHGSPAWTPDGQSIVFASGLGGTSALWRIAASGGASKPVPEAGNGVENPAISRRGFRLASDVIGSARNVEQLDLFPPGQKARELVTTMSGVNAGTQISPDGGNLVFMSDRTGALDLWVSDRDGRNPIQITAIGTTGGPRWSPDGKEIVFDVGLQRDWRAPRALFVVDRGGRSARPILRDNFSNGVPRWSRDGKWIYFASNRSGNWQIWKTQESGGTPVQVTHQGGFAAEESLDGKYLYYSKHNMPFPDIWRMPAEGGPEAPVFPGVRPGDWAAWTLVENGIVFIEPGPNDVPTVSLYDSKTQGVHHLGTLDKPPFWLTATRDGKTVIFDQPEDEERHVMLRENFR
jgi:Tol biopolymer transport system component/DNA-binding winged helix-turn-helix (wHTH) protein